MTEQDYKKWCKRCKQEEIIEIICAVIGIPLFIFLAWVYLKITPPQSNAINDLYPDPPAGALGK